MVNGDLMRYIDRKLLGIDPRKLSTEGLTCYIEKFTEEYNSMSLKEREHAERTTVFT